VGVWLGHTLTRLVCLPCVGKERVTILEQQSPSGFEQRPRIAMGMISWNALLNAISMVAGKSPTEKAATGRVSAIIGAVLLFAAISLGLAVAAMYVLRKLNPAPTFRLQRHGVR